MRAAFRRGCARLLDRLVDVEVIGQEQCPLMLVWEFTANPLFKARVHYFPPEVTDRDPHDHPRSFITFVLRGRYIDTSWERVELPDQKYMKTIELVEAGQVIYRPARHMHIVETDERGCWTFVLMGPTIREWGFMRLASSEWWPWGKYIQRFGGVIRCDAPPDKMGVETPIEDVPLPLGWLTDGEEAPKRTHLDYRGTPPPLAG